jgi:ribosome maturation factor RimP
LFEPDREVVEMATRGRATGRSTGFGSNRNAARNDPDRRPTVSPVDVAAVKSRVRDVIEPMAQSAGYDLEDLSVVRMGRRYVVRVTVDRDGGVGLDAVADLSRDISRALDEAEAEAGEFLAAEYILEVSSRGTDRPLTEPRHWRRNVGRLVTVRRVGGPLTARIVRADDAGATLSVDGVENTYPYADLGSGRIEVEFSRLDDIDEDELIAFDDDGTEDDAGPASADDADDADIDVSGHDARADGAGLDDDDDNRGRPGTSGYAGTNNVGEEEER